MKKKLLYLLFLLSTVQTWAQQLTINESSGWLESAFVKWIPLPEQTVIMFTTPEGSNQ